MKKDTRSKKYNVLDGSDISHILVDTLVKKGAVRLVHFGIFRAVLVKGRKRYDFKTRKMVDVPTFKQVTFTPAEGLREMLNTKS